MLNTHRLHRRTALCNSRGGFTLVELLVVIGIIAILAGVALGPITAGIKKAQQSAGVQTSRTIALAEFQYSNDNNQIYPFGTDAGKVADLLVAGNYIQDPGIFIISGAALETKYTGSATTPAYTTANVSWDFGETSTTAGLTPNAPDQTPLVVSTSGIDWSSGLSAAGPVTFTITNSAAPYGLNGSAVCYKSNSAKFILSSTANPGQVTLEDQSWQAGTTVKAALGGG